MAADKNEILLLKASLKGDTEAFEQIVSRYQGYVCAVTFSAVGDVEKSEELAHEAFISVWRSLDQLRDLGKFRGWLGTIARNIVRNSFRAKKRDVISTAAPIEFVDQSQVAGGHNDDNALTAERLAVVEQALKRIPEKYREVIVLYYRQGSSIKQVAELLELSEDAVKQRLSRGRKMIREQTAEMIETTISRSGPSKAFTGCVMGTIASLALKGAATAAAGAAGAASGSSVGSASGLGALFGTAVGKVAAAAVVAAIVVVAAVVINNSKGPDGANNNPVAVVDGARDDGTDSGGSVDPNLNVEGDLPADGAGDSAATVHVSVAAGATDTVDEVGNSARYIDPNTLTDIHFKRNHFKADGSMGSSREVWIKKPNCWRVDMSDYKTIINNGKLKLEIDPRNKTAQLVESSSAKAEIPEYPEPDMLFKMIKTGRNLISGKDIRQGNGLFESYHKIKEPVVGEKASGGLMKFPVNILEGEGHGIINFYVDSKTGLVRRIFSQAADAEEAGGDFEYLFDYSEIPAEVFSLKTPDGYKEYAKRLSPKFQGWIFDKDLKPVSNAEIYLYSERHRRGLSGRSDANGEFNFFIPIGDLDEDEALEYPLFVRAISKDHPGQLAWTVIQSPDSRHKLQAHIPSPGEIRREFKGSGMHGKCLAVHNVSLVLEEGSTISGYVLNKTTGEPVANADVELNASIRGYGWNLFDKIAGPGKTGGYDVKTDKDGLYVFTSLPTFAWPEEAKEQATKGAIHRASDYSTNINLRVSADGYLQEYRGFHLLPKDLLVDKQLDFSLRPTNVTVRGRVTNDSGDPIVGYVVKYCLDPIVGGSGGGFGKAVTDKNGDYEITGCAFDKNLMVKVESGYEGQNWGKDEMTKGREFVYYGYKNFPVGVIDGKLEYEVDIVLEKPKTFVAFDIKDSMGQPKKGVELQMMSRGGIVSHVWAKLLKGVSDKDGKCVISGLPNFEGEDFEVKVTYALVKRAGKGYEYKDVDEEIPEAEKKDYTPVYTYVQIKDMPDGEDGYFIEMTVPEKGKAFDSRKKVRLFDSEGNQVKRKIR